MNERKLFDPETTLDMCPQKATHTPCPTSYLEWHHWADEKSKTHDAQVCPTCGLFAIWTPRKAKRPRK